MVVAVLVAAAAALTEIYDTSFGWHLASGRAMFEAGEVLRADPFTFTAAGTPWIDHEWLFQVLLAAVWSVGGAPAAVLLRVVVVALLVLLVLRHGTAGGLSPPVALLLAAACLAGARMRLHVRPELLTLLLAPAVVGLYLHRSGGLPWRRVALIGGLVALGVNLHGGALVIPLMLAGLLAAEAAGAATGRARRDRLGGGAAAVGAAFAATLANPFGWRVWSVPFELAGMVGQAHVLNPEWFRPPLGQLWWLYATVAAALVLLALRERDIVRWALLLGISALALRYVRNVGLFYVLLPLAVAPSLARLPGLGAGARRRALPDAAALLAAGAIAVALLLAPWPRPGLGLSAAYYPVGAADFLAEQGLLERRLYNDVRFGGYLIGRFHPPYRVFIDDRNELHEPLLERMQSLHARSDVRGWQAMLDEHGITGALVRYHPPWQVHRPDGSVVERGFSALWFPPERWALVYWDDVAMVLVDRAAASAGWLARHELRARPDDLAFVRSELADGRLPARAVAIEAQRQLLAHPESRRARALLELALAHGGPPRAGAGWPPR